MSSTNNPTMSSSSASGPAHKPKIIWVDSDGNVYCYHDMVAVKRVAGIRSTRNNHEFYGCYLCQKEEVEMCLTLGGDSKILRLKNNALESKVQNLEVEKLNLEEEKKKKLKNEIVMISRPIDIKKLKMTLFAVLFVVVCYYLVK